MLSTDSWWFCFMIVIFEEIIAGICAFIKKINYGTIQNFRVLFKVEICTFVFGAAAFVSKVKKL